MTDGQPNHIQDGRSYGGTPVENFLNPLAAAPRYVYDKQTLKEIADEFEALADLFLEDQVYAKIIARTQAPGHDYASKNNAETIRNSGTALLTSLTQQEKYCREQAKKYRKALGTYNAAEDTHSQDVKNAGGSL
ncbi:hypothetical protein [Amycolatopsis benzoatilytica]|uniref:hypothetical protein n=1 Tax=Amycolatopsis benzoatilytica TaxID=346045 RepID=UPI00037E6DEF|nr:hypothetical protein [Amycolatopsis benzoatilytica]